jgi:hypothetical protein
MRALLRPAMSMHGGSMALVQNEVPSKTELSTRQRTGFVRSPSPPTETPEKPVTEN